MPYATLDPLNEVSQTTAGAAFRTARVQEVLRSEGNVRVRFEGVQAGVETQAVLALSGGAPPEPGDRVLVAWSPGESFVIAVLTRPPESGTQRSVSLSDGAKVRVTGTGPQENIQVLSRDQSVLIEYNPSRGSLRLNAPTGDLEITSAQGDIVLNAAGAVRLDGRTVAATGRTGVRLDVPHPSGSSSVDLGPAATCLSGQALSVSARHGRLNVERTTFVGKDVDARVATARLVAHRIERVVGQLHEQADRIYQTVKEALQIKAGRIRSVVRSTHHVKARKIVMKADDDVKVKGDRIHLG